MTLRKTAMTTIPRQFIGQSSLQASIENAGVVLVPVPYDATTSARSGTREGPEAILKASFQLEDYDLELESEPVRLGIATAHPLEPDVSGPEKMVEKVRGYCRTFHEKNKFVFVLGGEHTVSVGAARAAAKKYEDLSFLQIDAHMDLRDSFEGSPYSHACVARRLWEMGPVTAVGIRAGSREEYEWIQKKNAPVFWGRNICGNTDDSWMDDVVASLSERVYVTFDVDGLDPSIMPATGTPEPGGLGYYQALKLLRKVSEKRRVVACDLCELRPMQGQEASDYTAAAIVYKMIGYFFGR